MYMVSAPQSSPWYHPHENIDKKLECTNQSTHTVLYPPSSPAVTGLEPTI